MTTTWTQRVRDTPKVEPISIEFEGTRARMPAAVWRELLAAQERTSPDDVSAVRVEDGSRVAIVMTGSDWQRLMSYVGRLEHATREDTEND